MNPQEASETWRHKFLQCVREDFLYLYVTENPGVREADATSTMELMSTYYNNLEMEIIICGSLLGIRNHRIVESEDVVIEEVRRVISEESKCQEEIRGREWNSSTRGSWSQYMYGSHRVPMVGYRERMG